MPHFSNIPSYHFSKVPVRSLKKVGTLLFGSPGKTLTSGRPSRTFCGGTGTIKSPRATGIAILRELRANLGGNRRETCEIVAYPQVVEYLVNERRRQLSELETQFNKTILVKAESTYSAEQYFLRFH